MDERQWWLSYARGIISRWRDLMSGGCGNMMTDSLPPGGHGDTTTVSHIGCFKLSLPPGGCGNTKTVSNICCFKLILPPGGRSDTTTVSNIGCFKLILPPDVRSDTTTVSNIGCFKLTLPHGGRGDTKTNIHIGSLDFEVEFTAQRPLQRPIAILDFWSLKRSLVHGDMTINSLAGTLKLKYVSSPSANLWQFDGYWLWRGVKNYLKLK